MNVSAWPVTTCVILREPRLRRRSVRPDRCRKCRIARTRQPFRTRFRISVGSPHRVNCP